jgi:hypothetical protein
MTHALFQQQQFRIDPFLCFVVMPFTAELRNVYDVVESVVQDYCGLKCVRADKILRSDRITSDIWTNINEARFVIADLTDRNANVFYETGLAHAKSKPVILMTQNAEQVPFDLKEIRYFEYRSDDLNALRQNLPTYIKDYISTIPRDWNKNYELPNWNPYIKITSLEAPKSVSVGQPFEIVLHARNNGRPANQGYFSISFPNGIEALKIIDSNTETKVGVKGDSWKSGSEILSYPIAEGFKYAREPVWFSKKAYFIRVQGYAKRKGFLWFYVSASGSGETDAWSWDPEQVILDVDQRDENVYCGVIEVV